MDSKNRKTSDTNRKGGDFKRKTSETNRNMSDTNRKLNDTNRKTSDTNRKMSGVTRKTSDTNRKTSDTNRKSSDTNVKTIGTNTKMSSTNTKTVQSSTNTDMHSVHIRHGISMTVDSGAAILDRERKSDWGRNRASMLSSVLMRPLTELSKLNYVTLNWDSQAHVLANASEPKKIFHESGLHVPKGAGGWDAHAYIFGRKPSYNYDRTSLTEPKKIFHESGLHVPKGAGGWDAHAYIFGRKPSYNYDRTSLTAISLLRKSSTLLPCEENLIPAITHSEDDHITQFPVHVTSLMNEDNHWGCFYIFPELYGDVYSPTVRVRSPNDVPEIVNGVLTRELIATCLSYLKRTPILGDFVYIKLDLSCRHLVNIEVLQQFKYLVYLDLSTNYLTELTVLSHLLYLQFLSVAFNRLNTVLEYDTPQWFLSEVHYKYNSVKRIRDLSAFWSIAVLDLSHNNIKCISGLENLMFLRHLDLSFNHIQRLENLNHLRLLWLDVSYNNISSFEFGHQCGLFTLLHLEYLNLNENNLTSMKMFSGCTRLRELYARNNRFSTLLELAVYMRQMRRLTVLDLRANPICATPSYQEVVVKTFPILLNLDAEELDPMAHRMLKMTMQPDATVLASRRLLRLLYIEQLSKGHISQHIPPADTTEVPLVVLVGFEACGKGALARRLARECSSNVELALQHTTAMFHHPGHYVEVTRKRFDDMLLAGDFLTYSESEGESYGLSREQAFVTDGKVKIATMDLVGALILKDRGRRPYLILARCEDSMALARKQLERKEARNMSRVKRFSLEIPLEKSTLQVLISGRILVTGILNEIILSLPDEKEQSEFVMESECSLLLDSEIRQAVQNYAKGVNLLNLLAASSTTSLEEVCDRAYKSQQQGKDDSLCSLFKESQNTDEYASDIANGQGDSCQYLNNTNVKYRSSEIQRQRASSVGKSVDFTGYVSSTWKGNARESTSGVNSTNPSKSVTFTSAEAETQMTAEAERDLKGVKTTGLSGLLVEPPPSGPTADAEAADRAKVRSLSAKIPPWVAAGGHGPPRTSSGASVDDLDLWLAFLMETGLMHMSDPNTAAAEMSDLPTRADTKYILDDPDFIIRQLSFYYNMPNHIDDYEEIHRDNPGLFWDTVTMDDPDVAFYKLKKIVKDIVEHQQTLKPMFEIDFANMTDYSAVQKKLINIRNQIAPQRLFF